MLFLCAQAGAPPLGFVFTTCNEAAGEVCPIRRGWPLTAHWGVPDPAAFDGPDDRKALALLGTPIIRRRRVGLMLELPRQRLDAVAIGREIKDPGTH